MSYEIYTVEKDSFERISKIKQVDNINWADDVENVYITFDFETSEVLDVGQWIELYEKDDNKTVFYALITKRERTKKEIYKYSGFDTGFYLEKNKITIQYRKSSTISTAIVDACKKIGIECGQIPTINIPYTNLFKAETVSNILLKLLETAKEKGFKTHCYFDCYNGKLNLFEYEMKDNLKGYVANIYKLNSFDTINSFNITSSMEEMKNKILVITSVTKNKQTNINERYLTPDNENTAKYGMLQEIVEVDADKKINYKQVAEDTLKEKNKTTETLTLTVLGDYNMRKGTVTPIRNEKLGIDNYYSIKNSSHSISGKKETVTIGIEIFDL